MKKKKKKVLTKKQVYLGLSILDINKILMYQLCYDNKKTKLWRKYKIMLHGYR